MVLGIRNLGRGSWLVLLLRVVLPGVIQWVAGLEGKGQGALFACARAPPRVSLRNLPTLPSWRLQGSWVLPVARVGH